MRRARDRHTCTPRGRPASDAHPASLTHRPGTSAALRSFFGALLATLYSAQLERVRLLCFVNMHLSNIFHSTALLPLVVVAVATIDARELIHSVTGKAGSQEESGTCQVRKC